MATFGTSYNPSAVMMGRPASGSTPYLWGGKGPTPPIRGGAEKALPGMATVSAAPTPPSGIFGPEAVRAAGAGPFDAAYRQNLATYAGGQFSKPGGSLSFNPTDLGTFPGQPTGGGSAPIAGMPNTLLDMALGGQGASFSPPAPQPSTGVAPPDFGGLKQWMNQFLMQGRSGRMGSQVQ